MLNFVEIGFLWSLFSHINDAKMIYSPKTVDTGYVFNNKSHKSIITGVSMPSAASDPRAYVNFNAFPNKAIKNKGIPK